MPETPDEQLIKHLTDVHSIEEQALQQLRVAPRLAHDPELARAFREHLTETEDQERHVRARLTARAYSYEHMEMAAYDLLALVAERAGDQETADVARSIREQEAAMAERLAPNFDR